MKATIADVKTGYPKLTREDVEELIKENGIEMLRVEFVDLHGINRSKLLPAEMLEEAVEGGLAFASAIMSLGFENGVAEVKGLFEYNYDDMLIKADPSTFVILPYLEKTALLLGDLYYHKKPMQQSPRWFLKNMIAKYQELGLNPIAASELEFFIFNKNDGELTPYAKEANNCYTSNSRIDPLGYLAQLTRNFKAMDYKILYMNHEFYPGQYEYNWNHGQALKVADQACVFKGISKDIADQNNLLTTFMAKPKGADGGSGCHYHISLNSLETGENLFYDKDDAEGMSALLRHFVAGVLKHARPLVAFLAPTINCYKRYKPDSFAPYYIGWGYDNRTTYIRIPEERDKATRAEIRAGSAASNPYLALGGILAAGLDGILNKLEPPAIVKTDLYHDSKVQSEIVPRSLFRSLRELEKDEWLCEYAGEDLINNFIALKELEVESFTSFVTDWEWKNYSYHI
jgi:glutamine synthetase